MVSTSLVVMLLNYLYLLISQHLKQISVKEKEIEMRKGASFRVVEIKGEVAFAADDGKSMLKSMKKSIKSSASGPLETPGAEFDDKQ